jgi:hypothetical protein
MIAATPGRAEDDLVDAFHRWIVRESGADVLVEGGAYLRQSRGKRARDLSRGLRSRIWGIIPLTQVRPHE